MTRRHRRDFLLDSGGVSALAASRDLLLAYLELLEQRFDGALLIPIPVLTEVRSGQRGPDALIDRLIKAIGAVDDIYEPLTPVAATMPTTANRSANPSHLMSSVMPGIHFLAGGRTHRR